MGHNHSHTSVSGRKLVWTILFNLGITIAEFIGGILSGYLALLADAVHNLSDVAALVLAWFGVRASEKPATKRSTFGYQRAEVMIAFVSAVSLIVIAVFIVVEAYDRLITPQPITHPWLFLTIAVIGLIGNVVSIVLLHSEKGKSLNMKTAFLHMAFDAASSVVVIIGGVVIILTGWVLVDAILSTAIALAIVWSSYMVMYEAIAILMEAVPQSVDFDEVHAAIVGVEHVEDVHDLHIWSLSSTEIALSCHVAVANDNYDMGPQLIERLNNLLEEKFHIGHGTIQIETSDCSRPHVLCQRQNNSKETH